MSNSSDTKPSSLNPTAIETQGLAWLTPEEPAPLDEYCERFGVTPPSEATEADLPSAQSDTVRRLDREALDQGQLAGKWMLFVPPGEADSLWTTLATLVEEGRLWMAKSATAWGRDRGGYTDYALFAYVPNYLDYRDVERVRDILRTECGFSDPLDFKPDFYTERGIYPETAEDWGLESPARFTE